MSNTTGSEPYHVVVAGSAEEIGSLRAAWKTLLEQQESPVFNAEPDRFLSLVGTQQDARPHVILLTRDGQPLALVAGSIARTQIRCRFGYWRIWLPHLRCLSILYGGLLGQVNEETSRVLLDEIQRLLAASQADVVFLNHLNTESAMYGAVMSRIPGLRRSRFPRVEPHWVLTVPESLDAFYKTLSRGHKANLRNYMRKMDNQYAERAVFTTYVQEDSVGSFLSAASQVSVKTYQHALGTGLQDSEQTRDLLKAAARDGCFRGDILFIDGEPCAFQYGLIYKSQYLFEKRGFDPQWKSLNVGTVLFLHVLRDLCESEPRPRVIDFGFGDADYKRSYCDKCWNEASFYVFAPRIVPIGTNLMYSGMTGLSNGLARFFEKTGLIRRIKRFWRNLLQKQPREEKGGRGDG